MVLLPLKLDEQLAWHLTGAKMEWVSFYYKNIVSVIWKRPINAVQMDGSWYLLEAGSVT